MSELSITEIETSLKLLPQQIHDAGQVLVEAENKLAQAEAQLDIEKAKIRIQYADTELSAKVIESYAIVGTTEQINEVIMATKEVELKKLAKTLLEDKYISARKIANLRNIYQA